MTIEGITEEQSAHVATVGAAMDELALRLLASGIPAETIVAVITGWGAGQSVKILGADETARWMRTFAVRTEFESMPVAGSA